MASPRGVNFDPISDLIDVTGYSQFCHSDCERVTHLFCYFTPQNYYSSQYLGHLQDWQEVNSVFSQYLRQNIALKRFKGMTAGSV